MARITETVKNFLGFNSLAEDYDYDESEDSTESYGEEEISNSRFSGETTDNQSKSRISSLMNESSPISGGKSISRQESGKVLGLNAENALSVVLSRPTEYKDCTVICSKLRERTTVVVNFEQLKNMEDKKRILDFIYGCCYAIDGNAQRISEHVYIVAPYNVDIYDDVRDNGAVEGENPNFF